ncbi:MAG TPA: DUF59 domain-containing protein [bacterium]|nr:DUF59 domain-containing protein [bacterium]
MAHLPYSEKVMEHFRNPRNAGKMEDADGKGVEGSPACGDMVAVYIKVDKDKKKIDKISFESYGCASNIATASIITELAKGKTLEDAKQINWKKAADELGGLPAIKTHCSVLAVEGLRAAIRDYEEKNGIAARKEPTTVEVVTSRLKHVMNPIAGLDMVKTNLVKEIRVEEGKVTVVVALQPDHQFANAMREDVKEKIEPLWDVKEVEVVFTPEG